MQKNEVPQSSPSSVPLREQAPKENTHHSTSPKIIDAEIDHTGLKQCDACKEINNEYLFVAHDNKTSAVLCYACALAYAEDEELVELLEIFMSLINDKRNQNDTVMEWTEIENNISATDALLDECKLDINSYYLKTYGSIYYVNHSNDDGKWTVKEVIKNPVDRSKKFIDHPGSLATRGMAKLFVYDFIHQAVITRLIGIYRQSGTKDMTYHCKSLLFNSL